MTDKMRERVREFASEIVKHFFVVGDGAEKIAPWIEGQLTTFLDSLEREQGTQFPRPCGLCPGTIESSEDLEWHGIGNCLPLCERCLGSGVDPGYEREQGTASEALDRQLNLAFEFIAKANTISVLSLDEMKSVVGRTLRGVFDERPKLDRNKGS